MINPTFPSNDAPNISLPVSNPESFGARETTHNTTNHCHSFPPQVPINPSTKSYFPSGNLNMDWHPGEEYLEGAVLSESEGILGNKYGTAEIIS